MDPDYRNRKAKISSGRHRGRAIPPNREIAGTIPHPGHQPPSFSSHPAGHPVLGGLRCSQSEAAHASSSYPRAITDPIRRWPPARVSQCTCPSIAPTMYPRSTMYLSLYRAPGLTAAQGVSQFTCPFIACSPRAMTDPIRRWPPARVSQCTCPSIAPPIGGGDDAVAGGCPKAAFQPPGHEPETAQAAMCPPSSCGPPTGSLPGGPTVCLSLYRAGGCRKLPARPRSTVYPCSTMDLSLYRVTNRLIRHGPPSEWICADHTDPPAVCPEDSVFALGVPKKSRLDEDRALVLDRS